MPKDKRIFLIQELEKHFKSRILVLFLGDRAISPTRIADDSLRPMYDHLLEMKDFPDKKRRLQLFLYSVGGVTETPWKMVSMLREFCDTFEVIIPYKAYSAATMVALGADKTWMVKKAELGPIDPALQLVGAPEKQAQFLMPEIGVEDVASYISFLRNRAGLTDQSALSSGVQALAQNLTPPLLGRIERVYSHIRVVARKLLSLCQPPLDDRRITTIVEALTEKTYVHGHGIGRSEAEQIGLAVSNLDGKEAETTWELYKEYEEAFDLWASRDAQSYLLASGSDIYEETGVAAACTESSKMLHVFRGDVRIQKIRRLPQQTNININLNLGLPSGIDPAQIPQQIQAQIQQILQQGAEQIRQAILQEITRQAPVERLEGAFIGRKWTQENDF